MVLDGDIKAQLAQYMGLMEGDVHIQVSAGTDAVSQDMLGLMDEIVAMSPRIRVEKRSCRARRASA